MLALHGHGVSVAAHGIHVVVLLVGAAGLLALLAPTFLAHPQSPRDEHDVRVLALRTALADSRLATDTRATSPDPTQVATQENGLSRAQMLTTAQRVLVPLAAVSSVAAAGVHAAVGPAHFREATIFGLFFAGWALLLACCCIALQSRDRLPTRLVDWRHGHPATQWFTAGSVLVLVALSFSGASA